MYKGNLYMQVYIQSSEVNVDQMSSCILQHVY